MSYPKTLSDLIDSFSKLPGVGNKTAERMSFYILNMDDEDIELFSTSLNEIKSKIKYCSICHHITEDDTCEICKDTTRDDSVLCVVENIKDVIAFEKMKNFTGKYHVLSGAISPINGIMPDDLHIDTLLKRIQSGLIDELIFATNPTIEGETTANYITRLLDDESLKITRIAQGLPMGSDIEYADEITLTRAFEGRREI